MEGFSNTFFIALQSNDEWFFDHKNISSNKLLVLMHINFVADILTGDTFSNLSLGLHCWRNDSRHISFQPDNVNLILKNFPEFKGVVKESSEKVNAERTTIK